jgi:flagellar motor switch protein FliM
MQDESAEYLQGGEILSLQPGDVLEAETTTADAVDFVVYGTLS